MKKIILIIFMTFLLFSNLISKEVIIFDDDISWDGGFYRIYPATAFCGITSKEKTQGLFALQISYAPNCWSGAEIGKSNFDLTSLRNTGSLSFYIKGETGKESNITIYLVDSLDDGDAFRTDVPLSKYCKISKDWQQVFIPLKDFSDNGRYWHEPSQSFKLGKIDWTNMMEVSFDISPTQSDRPITIYVDDIRFIPEIKTTELPKTPLTGEWVFYDNGKLGEGISTAHYPAGSSAIEEVKAKTPKGDKALKAIFDPHKYSGIELMAGESYDLTKIKEEGAIELVLKGTVNTPEFYVGIVDSRADGMPVVSAESIDKYIKINNAEWQTATIPLNVFPAMGSWWSEEKQTTIPGELNWKDISEIQLYAGPSWGGESEFLIASAKILPVYVPDTKTLKKEIELVQNTYLDIKKIVNNAKKKGLNADIEKATANLKKAQEWIEYAKTLYEKKENKKSYDAIKQTKKSLEKAFAAGFESKTKEGRGLWIQYWSLSSPEEIKRFVTELADANFNMVFVESYILGGMTIWPSKIGVQFDQFKGWDPLKVLVDECHKRNVEVHSWFHIFRAGNNSPLFKTHPDWIEWEKPLTSFDPTVTYWVCPARVEYRDYVKSFIKELIDNYGIDGIQLDYIRYPESPKRSCWHCKGLFQEKTGIDPWLEETKNDVNAWMKWNIYRENLVTEFVKDISEFIRSYSPKTMISAAVWPENMHGFLTNYVIQDWENWVDNQYLDFICPMEYYTDAEAFERSVANVKARINGRIPIYHGMGQYLLANNFEILKQIQAIHNEKESGSCMFAMNSMLPSTYALLKEGPYKITAKTAHYISDKSKEGLAKREAERKAKIVKREQKEVALTLIEIPELTISKTKAKPVIDGKLNDPVWKTAARFGNYWQYDGAKKVQKDYQSYGYVTYDDSKIYFGIYCYKGSKNYLEKQGDGGKVWEDDSVEIFFDTEGKGNYVQFGINSKGARWASTGKIDFEVKTSKTDDGYIVEVAIPFALIGATPKTGDIWRVNTCRSDYDLMVPHNAWSCTYGSFLTPSRFGRYIFK